MEHLNVFPKPLLPLYLMHWIFGMGIIECPLGTPRPTLSLIYSSTLIMIYCVMAVIVYPEMCELYSKTETISLTMKIQFFSQVIITIIIIILNWIKCQVSSWLAISQPNIYLNCINKKSIY